MLDEFVLFGREQVDPWHRVSCCDEPALLFIEFCQVIGPKPLYCYPKNIGPHLDLDQVALWVMSSENLHGSVTCMYNQQMGLYALSLYSSILDLSARAFQRPFALVFLLNNRPSPSLVELFQNKGIELIRPFLACNRQHFQNLMQHLIHIVENIESDNFNNYYALLSSSIHLPSKPNLTKGLQLSAHRARIWYNRTLEGKNFYVTNGESKCDCGMELCEFEKFLPQIVTLSASTQLVPIIELAPCAGIGFFDSFKDAYREFLVLDERKGVLFAYKTPILRSICGANSKFEGDGAHENVLEEDTSELVAAGSEQKSSKQSSLKQFSSSLPHSVYHLFAGERIAVLASAQKERYGMDVLKKLNSLRTCKRFERAVWFSNQLERPISSENQLVGLLCNSANSADWSNPHYPIVIDLNYQRVKCREYSGKFLRPLHDTVARNFPSDRSILAFLVSLLTDIQQYTILVKYSTPRNIIDRLHLSIPDQLILVNSLIELNIAKYSYLKRDLQQFVDETQTKPIKL